MVEFDPGTEFLSWALTYNAYQRLGDGPDALTAVISVPRGEFERSGRVPAWCGVDLLRGWIFWLARKDHFEGYGHLVEPGYESNRELRSVVAALRNHPQVGADDLPPASTASVWGDTEQPSLTPVVSAALPPEVEEALGPFYVYALRDPRDSEVFYVGKGTGSRLLAHVWAVKATGGDATLSGSKVARIKAILDAGLEVEHLLLRVGIPSESIAYVVEQAVLDGYAAAGLGLTNVAAGHHSDSHGLATLADAIARFSAPPAPPLPSGSVLFLINQRWTLGDGDNVVYEKCHGYWKIGAESRAKAAVGFAVARGIIRGAYVMESWAPGDSAGEPGRWVFNGHPWVSATDYVGTHVCDLIGAAGSQNPVRLFLDGT